jgi:hypothetical protein
MMLFEDALTFFVVTLGIGVLSAVSFKLWEIIQGEKE